MAARPFSRHCCSAMAMTSEPNSSTSFASAVCSSAQANVSQPNNDGVIRFSPVAVTRSFLSPVGVI